MTPGWRKLLLIGSVFFVVQSYGQNMPAVVSMAKEADWENLESLLEDGLNPNVVYGDGTTALHWAQKICWMPERMLMLLPTLA